MSASDPNPSARSRDQVETLERWLAAFELAWHGGALREHAARLPADGPLRRAALVEMVKIDLERRARRGQVRLLTEYLADFPELARDGRPPDELRRAEAEVRREFGPAAASSAPWSDPLGPPTAEGSDASTVGHPGPALSGQFGRYRIVRPLGRGGMGRVYLAHDDRLDRPVALKVPRPDLLDNPTVVERFLREARVAATLSHPNLCPVYDADRVGDCHYLAMAYVEGRPLTDLLDPAAPLPVDRAIGLVVTIARAMAVAHARGVIHRDLKPANVMITPGGEPVVMDFGLARRVDRPDERLTRDGSFLGTPAYMPPEQISGDLGSIGPPSDVYSLGVILYELLTGRPPFRGSFGEVIDRALNEPPVPPSRLRPGLDPRLEAVCLRALAKRPADRYPGMAEFAAALEATGRPRTRSARRWLWPAVAGVVVLVVGAMAVKAVRGWGDRPEEPTTPAPAPDPPTGAPLGTVTGPPTGAPSGPATVPGTARPPGPPPPGPEEQALIAALEDKDPNVRRIAAEQLAARGTAAAVPALVRRVADDRWVSAGPSPLLATNRTAYDNADPKGPNRGSKAAALDALRKLGAGQTTEALGQALGSSNHRVRTWAATELGNQPAGDGPAALKHLLAALKDADGDVRRAAADALARRGDPAAADALVERVADDRWSDDHGPFLQIGDRSAYDDLNPEGPNRGSKAAALDALRKLAPHRVPEAINRATKSTNAKVKAWAIQQLSRPDSDK